MFLIKSKFHTVQTMRMYVYLHPSRYNSRYKLSNLVVKATTWRLRWIDTRANFRCWILRYEQVVLNMCSWYQTATGNATINSGRTLGRYVGKYKYLPPT